MDRRGAAALLVLQVDRASCAVMLQGRLISISAQLVLMSLQGRLENLRLGNMGLTGTVPACLFNGNSSLYQVGCAACCC